MVTAAVKLKDSFSWKKSYDQPRQHIKKQRHYCANTKEGMEAQIQRIDCGPSEGGKEWGKWRKWHWQIYTFVYKIDS